jgi:hypothetical protein
MTTVRGLCAALTILKGLTDLGIHSAGSRQVTSRRDLWVDLKSIATTRNCGYTIVRIGNHLLPEGQDLIWQATTRQYLSQKLGCPLMILPESNGDIAFIVCLKSTTAASGGALIFHA